VKPSHYAVLSGALAAVALQLANLHAWNDALTPAFISSALLTVGSAIGGIYVAPPAKQP